MTLHACWLPVYIVELSKEWSHRWHVLILGLVAKHRVPVTLAPSWRHQSWSLVSFVVVSGRLLVDSCSGYGLKLLLIIILIQELHRANLLGLPDSSIGQVDLVLLRRRSPLIDRLLLVAQVPGSLWKSHELNAHFIWDGGPFHLLLIILLIF